MSIAESISIVISDDHPIVRSGLEAVLRTQPNFEIVGTASDGEEGVALCLSKRPRVAFFDLKMPKLGGFDAICRLRIALPDLACIVVTSFDNEEDVHKCIKAGARGYLLKDAPVDQIVACVHAVAGGGRYIPSAVAERLAGRIQADALSDRELSILRFMASGQSNKGIARMAYISEGTVKFHVNNILAKLGADSRTGAVSCGLRRRLIEID